MVKLRNLLAVVSLSFGLGCGIPEGVPVKGDYPELTPEILSKLEEKVLDSVENGAQVVQNPLEYPPDESVVAFSGAPKEYINYFVDFTQEDYYLKGVSMNGLEGVKIAILPMSEVASICGDLSLITYHFNKDGLACHNNDGNIIMPDTLGIIGFFAIFNHEFGHHLYSSGAEHPAVANETYAPIKAYQFSRPIGSLMLDHGFRFPSMYTVDSSDPFERMYRRGAVFAALNLLEHRGDIEAAMDDVAHAKELEIETRLERKFEEYPGLSYDGFYFELWKDVLDDIAFSFELIEDTGHLSSGESKELVSYLRVLDHRNYLSLFPESEELLQEYRGLLEDFEKRESFDNPYFKARVVSPLSSWLHYDLTVNLPSKGVASDEVYSYARRIIDVNGDYPCYVGDAYECPSFMREARRSHLDAYYYLVIGAFAQDSFERKNEVKLYAVDFIERFFPGADFYGADFEAITDSEDNIASNYIPTIAVNSGHFCMYDLEDYDTAGKFFQAALAVNCVDSGSSPNRGYCESQRSRAEILLEELERLRQDG